jgi:hypothetical protein
MFDGISAFLAASVCVAVLVVCLPPAIWKLIELVAWLYQHVTIT